MTGLGWILATFTAHEYMLMLRHENKRKTKDVILFIEVNEGT